MSAAPQSFRNHARFVPLYHFVLGSLLLANLAYWTARVAQHPRHLTPFTVMQLLQALALMLLFYYARLFALTVQDRVIRLEMRLRLQALLPPERMARFGSLTVAQLTALRFAGDAELPELVLQVLDGSLTSGTTIKRAIKDWQGDFLRV
jgi:hypothetical protein